MDISLGKLQQLVTVARTGSFSRAAVELNISQPALSRSIAAIEARYGFQIFNRDGHGVQLTAAGQQVIEQARPLLENLRLFDSNLRLFGSGQVGTLAIGLAPLLASEFLAGFASEFFTAASRAQLQVMTRPGAALVDAMKNDLIELLFCPDGYIEVAPDIDMIEIGVIHPVCVVRHGHPLAARQGLTLADLSNYPWASAVAPQIIAEAVNPIQFVCDNYHVLRDAVLHSDLICICSASFVAPQLADGSLAAIQVAGLPLSTTAIYRAKLRGRVSSPLALEAEARMRRHLNGGRL